MGLTHLGDVLADKNIYLSHLESLIDPKTPLERKSKLRRILVQNCGLSDENILSISDYLKNGPASSTGTTPTQPAMAKSMAAFKAANTPRRMHVVP